MAFDIVQAVLSADLVPPSGTVNFAYPSDRFRGEYFGAAGHVLSAEQGNQYVAPGHFTLAFGASNMTLTWKGPRTLASGTRLSLQVNRQGRPDYYGHPGMNATYLTPAPVFLLGPVAPVNRVPTAIVNAQAVAAAGSVALNGSLVSDGYAEVDVDRALEVVSSAAGDTSQKVTAHGWDGYGMRLAEEFALNGTTARVGKKAFFGIDYVYVDAAMAGNLSIGTSNILGLPTFLPGTGHVLAVLKDNDVEAGATVTPGDRATPTATTGDVRGTLEVSTFDGTTAYGVVAALPDPNYLGAAQYQA